VSAGRWRYRVQEGSGQYESGPTVKLIQEEKVDKVEIKSSDLKKAVAAQDVPKPTWTRIVGLSAI
jgi:hypothetical protein